MQYQIIMSRNDSFNVISFSLNTEKLEKLQSELDDTKEQKELLVAEVKSLESQLRQELQEANGWFSSIIIPAH